MSTDLSRNKIAAAILLAGLIGMVSGKVTEFLYDGGPAHPGHHEEAVRGYKIDVPETSAAGGPAAVATAPDISALYASADVAAGKSYFDKKCTVCHNIDKGGANKVGPHLWGVMGRAIAGADGFNYSEAMKKHAAEDKNWDFATMNAFQWAPRKAVPGTLMAFAGTPKDQERANLIAYLNQQSDSPKPLPTAADAPKEAEPAADPAKDSTSDEKRTPAKAETTEKATPADSGNKGKNTDAQPADTDEPTADANADAKTDAKKAPATDDTADAKDEAKAAESAPTKKPAADANATDQ